MHECIILLLRFLLIAVYALPLGLPIVASLAHAADHMTATHGSLVTGSPTAERHAFRPHVHPHGGDHSHAGGEHGPAVAGLLSAADGLNEDEAVDRTSASERLRSHVPAAFAELPGSAVHVSVSLLTDRTAAGIPPPPPIFPPPRLLSDGTPITWA